MKTSLTAIASILENNGYAVELEYRFHPERRWRFDLALPAYKLALEVDGGLFVRGRHSRGAGIEKTHEKENAAATMGWRILKCQPRQVANFGALRIIEDALRWKE